MAGRYFEELTVGEVIVHEPSRTITEADNMLFCALTMNPQPLHLDHEFAKQSMHGRILVNGILTLGLTLGLTVYETSLGTTAGNLGFGGIRYPAPVFVGDTITAETEITGKRLSQSRPGMGVVDLVHRARNQDGTVVMECSRSGLWLCRPAEEGNHA